jgi:chemotaxis protein CheY-P-specific phosphatase CheC
MEAGSEQIADTLEMLTGQSLDQHSVQIKAIAGTDLMKQLNFGAGPVAAVSSVVHGDIEGDLLFLQSQYDFKTLSEIMSPALTGDSGQAADEATDYLTSDWDQKSRKIDPHSNEFKALMKEAYAELGNVLFGIYLTAFYSNCKLVTYQDLPTALIMDDDQSTINKALSLNGIDPGVAFTLGINCSIAGKQLEAWVLLVPVVSKLQETLDEMDISA